MKKSLRIALKKVRAIKSKQEALTHSNLIVSRIVTLLQTVQPCIVAIYYPHSGEPNLLSLTQRPELQKFEWAFPVCSFDQNLKVLRFARFSGFDAFEIGEYGIPVPSGANWVQPDWVIIPSLALNSQGFRLGYGAGWYDRTLNELTQLDLKPVTVGITWQEALISDLFQEPHDQAVDYVVTPMSFIHVKKERT